MVLAPRAPSSHAPMTNPQPRRLRAQARSNRSYVARRLGCPLRRPPPVVRRRDRSRCGQHADGVASTTHSSGVFACRAATVASGRRESAEQRPSVSAATGDRCGARPRSTARMARARRARRVQERVRLPDLTPNRTSRSSRARCPAASSGASRPLRDRQRADRGAGCAQDACSHHLQGSGWRVAHHFSSAPLIQECRRAATSPGWRRGKGRERSVCPFSWNGVSREESRPSRLGTFRLSPVSPPGPRNPPYFRRRVFLERPSELINQAARRVATPPRWGPHAIRRPAAFTLACITSRGMIYLC
jgi:hypothetical protein